MKFETALKIAIIGTGNVAYHLSKRLKELGIPPSLVISRNAYTRQNFIELLNLNHANSSQVNNIDFVILAVPDDQIEKVDVKQHLSSETVVLHASGSQPISVLSKHPNSGVLYPLQTFSKNKTVDWANIPILIEGDSDLTINKIEKLAHKLTSKVIEMNSENRLKVHLAAVFACNFSNALFQISSDLLQKINLDFNDLHHLINETIDKAAELGPENAQTGPAVRGDIAVIEKHLQILEESESSHSIYKLMSKVINPSLEI